MTRERQPTGAIQRAEDAQDGEQLFGLTVALEDTNWLQNDDKRRIRAFVTKATRRIELSRLPDCRWYEFACNRRRRELSKQIEHAARPP